MKNKYLHFVGVIFVGLVLAACNGCAPPSGNEASLEVNETAVSEDTVAEPIYLNNCGNPASVKQVSQHSQAIMIGGGANIGASGGVISGSVEGKYSSTKNVAKSLTVEAAPNTNMKFVLLWTEKVSEGTVTATGQSGQATYRVSVPISVELSSAEDLGCSTSTPESPATILASTATPTQTPDTASPTITLTSQPEYACGTANEQPLDNTEFERGQSFRVQFAIVNTGSAIWPEDTLLVITSNPYKTIDPAPYPIKVPRVQPGDYYNVGPFNATAPNVEGHYVIDFQLGDNICWPYLAFNVVK